MKEQLIQYVDLLFAGTGDCDDIKQEILQNTLDRYDDLIAEGKSPEAAYRLAIIGIGDVNEILGTAKPAAHSGTCTAPAASQPQKKLDEDTPVKKVLRAVAIGLYILCPLPVIVLSELFGWDALGVCGTLFFIAIATVLLMLGSTKEKEDTEKKGKAPESPLQKSLSSLVWAIGLAVYFVISFATGAWYVTWILFPILSAVEGLIKAIFDLKEASKYEN